MEEQIERIKQVLYSYENAGLVEGNPQKVLSYLTEDVIGIGMGEQGLVRSKSEIRDIMLNSIKKEDEASYELKFEDMEIRFISDTSANLCTKVYVTKAFKGKEAVSGFMQSLSLVLKQGNWYICCLHASPIMLSEECIESFPLTFADYTLENLRTELQGEAFLMVNQSLSAGILGTYQKEHYPACFANDALLEIIGYSRSEFEEKFSDGMDKIVPPDEKKRLSEFVKEKEGKEEHYAARMQWLKKDGSRIWVEFRTKKTQDEQENAIYLTVVLDVSEIMNLQMAANRQAQTMLSSIRYASKIQRNILPFDSTFQHSFSDYAVLWFPKDVVGGDIYWIKRFAAGTVLAVCDCTGHGVPGALLTILVTSILEAVVTESNCMETDEIMLELDRRIYAALRTESQKDLNIMNQIQDGCDIALIFISTHKSVTVSTSNIHIFWYDGKDVNQLKGQRLYIGERKLCSREEIRKVKFMANEAYTFFIATDGLYDQIGGEELQPFGYKKVKEIILQYHNKKQKELADKIWQKFETYRGDNMRRDDIEIIAFKP